MPAVRSASPRRLRADAQRNRARLIDAARAVFVEAGQAADVSLEEIARRAEVGVGTLYRHFPTRLDLMEAVYRDDVDELRTRATELAATASEWDALVGWLRRFIEYATTKRVIVHELADAVGRDSALITHSRALINDASSELLGRAQAAGVARSDLTPSDLLRLVGGCAMMPNLEPGQRERILHVVLDGIHIHQERA